MRCQNCGHDNDLDATFCEKCGSQLDRSSNYRRPPREFEKTGMNTSTKLLIVAVIALVAILGVFAGAWMMNPSKTPANTPVSANESAEKVIVPSRQKGNALKW